MQTFWVFLFSFFPPGVFILHHPFLIFFFRFVCAFKCVQTDAHRHACVWEEMRISRLGSDPSVCQVVAEIFFTPAEIADFELTAGIKHHLYAKSQECHAKEFTQLRMQGGFRSNSRPLGPSHIPISRLRTMRDHGSSRRATRPVVPIILPTPWADPVHIIASFRARIAHEYPQRSRRSLPPPRIDGGPKHLRPLFAGSPHEDYEDLQVHSSFD